MKNDTKVTSIGSELQRIRKAFKFSRKDFAFMFGVSPATVDSWCSRGKNPSPTNTRQLTEYLCDFRQSRGAYGFIVLPNDTTSQNELIKRDAIVEQYCKSNFLDLLSITAISKTNYQNLKSLNDQFNVGYTKEKNTQHFIFYSDEDTLSDVFKKELLDANYIYFHHLSNSTAKIDKL